MNLDKRDKEMRKMMVGACFLQFIIWIGALIALGAFVVVVAMILIRILGG